MVSMLASRAHWLPEVAAGARWTAGAWGVPFARTLGQATLGMLVAVPAVRIGPLRRLSTALPSTCLRWIPRLALHLCALALWLGLLVPPFWLLHRVGDPPALMRPHNHAGDTMLDQLHAMPLWRKALGTLPLATLCWGLWPVPSLMLAPAWALLWLLAAHALWWTAL